jgi:hypothetical protein
MFKLLGERNTIGNLPNISEEKAVTLSLFL